MEQIFTKNNFNSVDIWFEKIAELLLNNIILMINNVEHKILEIEFYYNGDGHSDPYAHCSKFQKNFEKWYFHRINNSYKAGSFKGLDITFGKNNDYGGILLRSIKTPMETIINGPCLCVNYILKTTNYNSISDIDKILSLSDIWNNKNPIYLKKSQKTFNHKIYKTQRVGLSLKKINIYPSMPIFLKKNYRFLSHTKLKKGKEYTILSLYKKGVSLEKIKKLTGSNLKTINKYIREFFD